MITAQEIADMVFARNINPAHFTDMSISVAERKYIKGYLGEGLYDKVVANIAAYQAFVDGYVKPALAYAVAFDELENIRFEVTDRGINQFIGEGATSAGDISGMKISLALKRDSAVSDMVNYARLTYPDDYAEQESFINRVHGVYSQPIRRNYV